MSHTNFQAESLQLLSHEQARQAQELVRLNANSKQTECFNILSNWNQEGRHSQTTTLYINEPGPGDKLAACAVLCPCDIVTQWGSRHPLHLLLPIYARSRKNVPALLQQACHYSQQKLASENLGILLLISNLEHFAQLNPPQSLIEAWKYVVTVSLTIPEEAVWLLPLQESELQRYGGEVELPRELGLLWDCLE